MIAACRCLLLFLLSFTCAACLGAPPTYTVETVVGSGQPGDFSPPGGAPLAVAIDQPFGVEFGPDGCLYIASVGQHRVLRWDLSGQRVTCYAGTGVKGHSGDGGPATAATLNEPYEVRFDRAGNLYFVEMMNHLIRRVDAKTGTISTVAGAPEAGLAGDGGLARDARFKQPHSIAFDDRGYLYVADIGNHRIRRIDPSSGAITTIAGNGQRMLPADGAKAEGGPILGPRALFIVGRTMWIALREGHSVWRLDLDSGRIRHVAGTGKAGYSGDGGAPAQATFNGPKGIAADAQGRVFLVDSENQAIRLIDTKAGRVETIAGTGPRGRGYSGDGGDALQAKFDRPHGVGLRTDGAIYIGDTNNHRVRRLVARP